MGTYTAKLNFEYGERGLRISGIWKTPNGSIKSGFLGKNTGTAAKELASEYGNKNVDNSIILSPESIVGLYPGCDEKQLNEFRSHLEKELPGVSIEINLNHEGE